MKVYVILSDWFPKLDNKYDDRYAERGIFQGVCPSKDTAISRLSDMIHTAVINDPECVYYRCKTEIAKKKEAIILYGCNMRDANSYIYIRECDLEVINND